MIFDAFKRDEGTCKRRLYLSISPTKCSILGTEEWSEERTLDSPVYSKCYLYSYSLLALVFQGL